MKIDDWSMMGGNGEPDSEWGQLGRQLATELADKYGKELALQAWDANYQLLNVWARVQALHGPEQGQGFLIHMSQILSQITNAILTRKKE